MSKKIIVGDVVRYKKYGKIKMTVKEIYAGIVTVVWAVKRRNGTYDSFKEKKICILELKHSK